MEYKMPKTLRLTKTEEKQLHDKCIEVNKKLITMGKMPIKESELAHVIFHKTIKFVKVNKAGELIIHTE